MQVQDMTLSQKTVDAQPTKEFFIDMLIKDIDLVDAISDMVDNSIDGARRMRSTEDFNGLSVDITYDSQQFQITDNCGGIPVDIARDYAFRFGRPQEVPPTPHSTGRFGIGMKRALFKLGKLFSITSNAATSSFTLSVDVAEWSTRPRDWTFSFDSVTLHPKKISPSNQGTEIRVTNLNDGVRKDFGLPSFTKKLRDQLSNQHLDALTRGLVIRTNKEPLLRRDLKLSLSPVLQPAHYVDELPDPNPNGKPPAPVKVNLYAGIGNSSPSQAGWYVFCNGRSVLTADRSTATGWGTDERDRIPVYHNQFARFRGYLFLDSDDAANLPWTTTKTGLDQDAPIYRTVKEHMITEMRPVITFLNHLDQEKDRPKRPLGDIVESAPLVPISEVQRLGKFHCEAEPGPTETLVSISYRRPKALVDKVKRQLRAKSYRQTGEMTFDYYVEAEEDDN